MSAEDARVLEPEPPLEPEAWRAPGDDEMPPDPDGGRRDSSIGLEAELPPEASTAEPGGFDLGEGGARSPEQDFAAMPELPPRRGARNVPGLLMIGGALLAGLFLLAALGSLLAGSRPGESGTAVPGTEAAVGGAQPLAAAVPEPAQSPAQRLLTELGGSLAEMRSQLSEATQAAGRNAADLAELKAKAGAPAALPEAVSARLAALDGALTQAAGAPQRLEQQQSALAELSTRLATLEAALTQVQLTQARQAKARAQAEQAELPPPPVKLPFRLAAIDSWDGRLYAALAMRGQIDLLQAGERYAGWTVEAIDGARREVLFARDGRRATRRAPD